MKEITVVKYGSETVTNGHGVDHSRIAQHSQRLASLTDRNNVIIVSSGAVAVGRSRFERMRGASDKVDRQVLASMGSAGINAAWEEALEREGMIGGQLLTTHREIDDPVEGGSLIQGIRKMLAADVVPVVNENDLVSDLELKKLIYNGDNDGLAAHIASSLGADTLFLMTKVEGLYAMNGVVREVEYTQEHHEIAGSFAGDSDGQTGTGGMRYKVLAASQAADAGVNAYIAKSDIPFSNILAGESGTHFVAK